MIEPSKPPRSLLSAAGRAIGDFSMIREGDRVLLGLSGGKDSLALLHVLIALQKKAPIHFDLGVCTVDPQSSAFDPAPLKPYMAELGMRYFFESQPILEEAKKTLKEGDSYCAYCSRMRRGILYRVARENGYNVLALAQHLDDLAETFMMNAFFGGKLRTMKPSYLNDAGDVRVIRPFAYVRERQTAAYVQSAALPIIPDNCPACFGDGAERSHMKQILAQLEKDNTKLFPSLLRAMRPLMEDTPGMPTERIHMQAQPAELE
ncbi:cell cycle control ATPase [Sulfuricella denitrificans skB26]|uniref:Cell cycle control ATPase n=1 Tax=Sulfuricella denitrificans (strain DSM 22764 / NBRC 105220 / skB26) TaxID=1163617 RepID=S6AB33_SULDS|nr:tRNA 2-thiocytidine(32) synthetase TtcA [Sulfuricella denitrificans]BAN34263.1 cell cycle control ATPase [Sulfuricella denitrificans skB26]